MNAPCVSIVMPVRDGGRRLLAAVESLRAQSLAAFELVVVDDHSHDGACAALPDDPRIRVIRNPGHGVVDALNAGWRATRAELVARMDADDLASPDRLERQLGHLAAYPRLGMVSGQVEIFRDDGPVGGGFARYQAWLNALCRPERIAREIFVENPLPHPTLLLRRALLERLGGYHQAPWSEDYDLVLRAHAAGIAMGKPRGIVLRWRDHPGRLTRRDPRCAPDAFARCKAHYLGRRLAGRPVRLWGAGRTGARFHDRLAEQGVAVEGFIDIDPRKVGNRKRALPVVAPAAMDALGQGLIVGAVGTAGARERIRRWLTRHGRREGSDFVFAA